MKIGWGTGIVLAIVSFMSFIVYLGYQMITQNKYNHALVTDSYYQEELAFQKSINSQENANKLSKKIVLGKSDKGLIAYFPQELTTTNVKGNIFFYRPSNAGLDFNMPIIIKDGQMLIPDTKLINGRWNVKVKFTYKDKEYLHKQQLKY